MVRRAPDTEQLAQFPEELDVGGFFCKATYRFQPGAEDDGISVNIPIDLLSQVDPARLEWLVPGMLLEKITFLLKGLPKALRRQLIPVPDTARAIFAELPFGQGNFYGALQELVMTGKQVRIERGDWPLDSLSDHLKVRFCLIDSRGRIVKVSRNFADLAAPSRKRPSEALLLEVKKEWQRDDLAGWDFAGLPEKIPIKDRQGRLQGFAWPALETDEQGRVNLRLFADRQEAASRTTAGLPALYLKHFQKPGKIIKELALGKECWALYEGLGGRDEVDRDLASFIPAEIFAARDGVIPGRRVFEERLALVKEKGLPRLGRELLEQVKAVLRERRTVLDRINRYENMAAPGTAKNRIADFRHHLESVLPADFLKTFDG
ncbi:MAG: DUF3418 domain-containing protein, partial [Desulfobulbaceae bacterium]|nr:DUF3418 domain-containing protein [Desulfobulbaceae bacterium]